VTDEEVKELLRKANRIEVGKGDILWLRVEAGRDRIPPTKIGEHFDRLRSAVQEFFEKHNLPCPPILVSDSSVDAKVLSVRDLLSPIDALGLIGDTVEVNGD